MNFRRPQNTDKYYWTDHSIFKMKQYGLSAQRILRVIRAPKRKEEGIVKNTIAVMQPTSISHKNGKVKWSQEIWAMYQLKNSKSQETNSKPRAAEQSSLRGKQIRNSKFEIRNLANRQIRIISAWRYPGISPKKNPVPEEIISELSELA